MSYCTSHLAAHKGTAYDRHYRTDPRRRYLWAHEQRVLRHIFETYFTGRPVHLLDFACGTGRVSAFLEGRVTSSVGVDISEAMLSRARRKLVRTELVHADLTQRNALFGRSFNLITVFRFFLNAERSLRDETIRILASLLTRDGYLVFNNHRNWAAPAVFLRRVLCPSSGAKRAAVMSLHEMRCVAASGGLEIAKLYPVGLVFKGPFGLELPASWADRLERTAARLECLASLSESPIALCRHPASLLR